MAGWLMVLDGRRSDEKLSLGILGRGAMRSAFLQARLHGLVCAAILAGCDPRPLIYGDGSQLAAPKLLRPFQGETTGSPLADSALRPLFRWLASVGASEYELEIDDSCSGPRNCLFPSPEILQRTTATSSRPPAPLVVALTTPVGRRYYWHVRGCVASACGEWSSTRYVDVGRQRQDFNGDGYGDLVVGGSGQIWVYFGSATLREEVGWSAAPTDSAASFGSVSWMGDMDGDGFSELAVISCTHDCVASIFKGGRQPASTPAATVNMPPGAAAPTVAFSGDIDGDGQADLMAVRADPVVSRVLLAFGDPVTMVSDPHTAMLDGSEDRVVGGCDFDGDGANDVLGVAAGQIVVADGHSREMGTDFSFRSAGSASLSTFALTCAGDLDGSGSASAVLIQEASTTETLMVLQPQGPCTKRSLPQPSGGFAGRPVAAGLFDRSGSGFHDLVVGDPRANRVVFIPGGVCPPAPYQIVVHSVVGSGNSNTGSAVASPGDMDGDGFDEAAVANPITGIDGIIRGEVYVFRGGLAAPGPAPDLTVARSGSFGASID
jgi:hypothetical protein